MVQVLDMLMLMQSPVATGSRKACELKGPPQARQDKPVTMYVHDWLDCVGVAS
jgi:hypothetical protein